MHIKSFLLSLICICMGASSGSEAPYDYCHHPDCSLRNQHVMCGSAERVSPRLFAAGMSQWMRHQALLLHNRHRDNIAMGLEAGQPPASNMRKMYWDHELEVMAQRWARQCQKRHDECRNTRRFNVLQNVDVRRVVARMTEAQLLADAVASWFSGARQLPPENVYSFKLSNCSSEGGCNAHWYSAAAWGSTWRLGCAQALCTERRRSCTGFRHRRSLNLTGIATTAPSSSSESHVRRLHWSASSRSFENFAEIPNLDSGMSPLHRGVKREQKDYKERSFLAYTVCNYGPAGNTEGFPMYHAGSHCLACPAGTSCDDSTHRALCSLLGDPDTITELPIADY